MAYTHRVPQAGAVGRSRIVAVEADVLGYNNELAAANRAWLAERGILALNLVSSPGSGKTALLCRTVTALMDQGEAVAVIEGDQQTSHDAERIRATGAAAVQINTGKSCHLDAEMVGKALNRVPLDEEGVLFIENVGNLVCPAAFDLGEAHKVVLLSVTEGDDKPEKYPDMFAAASALVITKTDLLPYVPFDVDKAVRAARMLNPDLAVMTLSSTTGAGMASWLHWIGQQRE